MFVRYLSPSLPSSALNPHPILLDHSWSTPSTAVLLYQATLHNTHFSHSCHIVWTCKLFRLLTPVKHLQRRTAILTSELATNYFEPCLSTILAVYSSSTTCVWMPLRLMRSCLHGLLGSAFSALCGVNLCDVNLCDVNLCVVNLCGVKLCDVKMCVEKRDLSAGIFYNPSPGR